MSDYLAGLAFLSLVIIGMTFIQLKDDRYKRLQKENINLNTIILNLRADLHDHKKEIDRLERNSTILLKYKRRSEALEEELKSIKTAQDYFSLKRLEQLENFIEASRTESNFIFLTTFNPTRLLGIEKKLNQLLKKAEYEILIVSPWIKRQTWDGLKGILNKFIRSGGTLKVFMRGCESDFSTGIGDDLRREISDLGGETVLVKQLHAKLYIVDRKEAIITSANLTKGGMEDNYEAGIWLNDPLILGDICSFVEDLYRERLTQNQLNNN
ncbi:MAG: phospholipase D-like domain-containing protein [Methanotrichaceae archaeon]|nr:phospholipase D-like domain-containing protein [Methanotrichaceae archaeon]